MFAMGHYSLERLFAKHVKCQFTRPVYFHEMIMAGARISPGDPIYVRAYNAAVFGAHNAVSEAAIREVITKGTPVFPAISPRVPPFVAYAARHGLSVLDSNRFRALYVEKFGRHRYNKEISRPYTMTG